MKQIDSTLSCSSKRNKLAPIVPDRSKKPLGWYAQRRCTFTLERNADFGHRAVLLNVENSGIPAAT